MVKGKIRLPFGAIWAYFQLWTGCRFVIFYILILGANNTVCGRIHIFHIVNCDIHTNDRIPQWSCNMFKNTHQNHESCLADMKGMFLVRLCWKNLNMAGNTETRSGVGKSPWVFRLSLCLFDFTAMVFRHVPIGGLFFWHGRQRTWSAKFGPVPLWSMYRSSPLRSTLNTSYITALGMCKVCTEAVHSVALWTRVTLGLGMCKVCTEAIHSVALWTRVTLGLDMCKV